MSWLFGKAKEPHQQAPAPLAQQQTTKNPPPPPARHGGPAAAVKPPASQIQELLGLQEQAKQKAEQDKAKGATLVIDIKAALARGDKTGEC